MSTICRTSSTVHFVIPCLAGAIVFSALLFLLVKIVGGERELVMFVYYGPSSYSDIKLDLELTGNSLKKYSADDPEFACTISNKLVYRARAFAYLGAPRMAVAMCTRAIKLSPSEFAYAERAYAYSLLGEYDRAYEDIELAMKHHKWDKGGYVIKTRGKILVNAGDYNEGISCFSRAIELSPEDYTAYFERSRALYAVGRYAESLADIDRAIEKRHTSTHYEFKGVVCQAMGRYSESISSFSKAIAIDPALASAYRHRAVSHRAVGFRDLARVDFAKADSLMDVPPGTLVSYPQPQKN